MQSPTSLSRIEPERACSFCGEPEASAGRLVSAAPFGGSERVFICAPCLHLSHDILHDGADGGGVRRASRTTPAALVAAMDRQVIGQTQAKRCLAVAAYNHLKRLRQADQGGDLEIDKSNVLLVGPTGSGKTLLVRALARHLDVPFAMADATALTQAGYVGDDVESVVARLAKAAGWDVARAERGIVFIDEIDKIARKSTQSSVGRDVSGEGVQQGLLRILEGTRCDVRRTDRPERPIGAERVAIDTRHVLFVCGGAFEGLERIVGRRRRSASVGFGAAPADAGTSDVMADLRPEDLVAYGFIPEFVGRLPNVALLAPLRHGDLVRILTEPRDALIRQYERLFAMSGARLEVTAAALDAIAARALARGTGARGLRAVVEEVLLGAMYEVPGQHDVEAVVVGPEAVEGLSPPVYLRRGGALAGSGATMAPWADVRDPVRAEA